MKTKSYLRWGLTVTLSACAILLFYDTFFQDGVLLLFVKKLLNILKPVVYGFALAYLLAPIVNFFDRLFSCYAIIITAVEFNIQILYNYICNR